MSESFIKSCSEQTLVAIPSNQFSITLIIKRISTETAHYRSKKLSLKRIEASKWNFGGVKSEQSHFPDIMISSFRSENDPFQLKRLDQASKTSNNVLCLDLNSFLWQNSTFVVFSILQQK